MRDAAAKASNEPKVKIEMDRSKLCSHKLNTYKPPAATCGTQFNSKLVASPRSGAHVAVLSQTRKDWLSSVSLVDNGETDVLRGGWR